MEITAVTLTPLVSLIAGVLILLVAGRMALRYLDWQTSEATRQEVPPRLR